MFSRVARRIVQQQKRNFSVADKRQKFYANPETGAANPTYLKEGTGDRILTTIGLGVGTIGVVTILKGLFDMTLGLNKIKK